MFYEESRHIIKKCAFSMKIYKKWWDIAKLHPQLFVDEKLKAPGNHPSFRAHRHDQSIWSLLCKINNVDECVTRFTTKEELRAKFPFIMMRNRTQPAHKWLVDWSTKGELKH